MTSNIANLSISPDVLKMLGRKLYSSHPLPIVVRELLQNSVDACNRRGIDPKIKITIEGDGETIKVTCKDNGEGMDEETLIGKFLCLGESGKRDNAKSTGGFGIAKAAIMSNPFWSVRTHEHYTDSTMLGKPLKKMAYLDGTTVKVTIDENWYSSTINTALRMVYLSDVKIHLIYKDNDEIRLDDNQAGLTQAKIPDFLNDKFSISLMEPFQVKDVTNIANQNAYRLNGLVQFMHHSYDRNTNVIVDLFTDKSPVDKDYPLSMSRESIETSIRSDVSVKIAYYDENPLTTESRMARHGEEQTEKVGEGILLCRTSQGDEKASVPVLGKIQTLIKDDVQLSAVEKRVLRLWGMILSVTTKPGDYYGIGIETNPTTTACRMYHDENDYYLLNVQMILDEREWTKDTLIFRLHMLAVHEACHYELSGHNERFTSEMDEMYAESIGRILANMSNFRCIHGGDFPS